MEHRFNTSFLAQALSFCFKSLYAFKVAKMVARDQLNGQMLLVLKQHAVDTRVELL